MLRPDTTNNPRLSLLWVREGSLEPLLADHIVSVICNVNLANIIVLSVRYFLPGLDPISLMPSLCSASRL